MNKPVTTLFMLESVDGKISTGDVDSLDVDKDFKKISGVKEGLHQYYEIEQTTDLVSLNSGRVLEKIGANKQNLVDVKKTEVSFIVVDNKPHLDKNGCEYFAKKSNIFYLVTTNKNHPAYQLLDKYDNIKIIYFEKEIDFETLFIKFKRDYGIERITIQTGGTLNSKLLKLKLIDYISIVVAPCLIGGKNTQSLIGGESIHNEKELENIKALKLLKCEMLKDSYIHLQYEVLRN